MRRFLIAPLLVAATLADPALAFDRFSTIAPGARAQVSDPDERLERMAAASTPATSGHGKPRRSARNLLRDDPTLRDAFAWLDNR